MVLMHKTREALRDGRLGIFLKTPNGSVFFEFGDIGHKIGLKRGLTKRAAFFSGCLVLPAFKDQRQYQPDSGTIR
jgi:hypothetical protein